MSDGHRGQFAHRRFCRKVRDEGGQLDYGFSFADLVTFASGIVGWLVKGNRQ